ncbi:MAG: malto-oligosyltrehalose trehalohydrolase, partial [Myxococcales bacterium]
LERLRDLGITAIELMPVAQFPGARNWGYDGVYPYAVQDSYGGPRDLQQLIDECHRVGIAVVLDVVYNHLGPEGNYLAEFAPYFTDAYQTPWGSALNFDGPHSGGVREFFIQNALQWVEDFHVDTLRLDAVHSIFDRSAVTFLEELADAVHGRAEELGRHVYLIGESDLNDPRVVRSSDLGGFGLDAMWCDDFHHATHVLLTGESSGYYADFGRVTDLARAFRFGMSHPGEYSPFRHRRHGRPGPELRPEQFVICIQNHDQVGNRLFGDRLSKLIGFEAQKLAAGLLCSAPFLPLLFMGQEYGETAPFQYWVSHGDPDLLEAVRQGRRREFAAFGVSESAPDAASPETFEQSRLNLTLRDRGQHALLNRFYQRLLELRATRASLDRVDAIAFEEQQVLLVEDATSDWSVFCFVRETTKVTLPVLPGHWRQLIASADPEWGGPGVQLPKQIQSEGTVEAVLSPYSFVTYQRQGANS